MVIMKTLVASGLLVALVAFAGIALADGGSLQDWEVQKLFESSAQAVESTRPAMAGPAVKVTSIPAYIEYRGLDSN